MEETWNCQRTQLIESKRSGRVLQIFDRGNKGENIEEVLAEMIVKEEAVRNKGEKRGMF